MSFLKSKTIYYFKKAKKALSSFAVLKFGRNHDDQTKLDKKLVYSLSPKKIPDGKQLKHFNKFLSRKESSFIKIALIIFFLGVVFLGYSFLEKNVSRAPRNGGTYSEGLVGYPKNINPLYSSSRSVDSDIASLIYSSLFDYNKEGILVNDLVDYYEVNEDGKEYYIKIIEGVKWHDEGFLSADDVVFTFNLIKDESYRSPLRQNFVNAEVEKIDDHTIKFILSEPYAPFISLLTFGIMPKDLWVNSNPDSIVLSEFNLKPIGSGPFKFRSIVKTKTGEIREMNLEANEDYYKKRPYLNNIKFVFFPDKQEAIRALNDKRILGISNLPFSLRDNILAKNSLYYRELVQPHTISIFFNDKNNENLDDIDYRKNLSIAIDKDKIINDIFSGSYKVANSTFLPLEGYSSLGNVNSNYNFEQAESFFKEKEFEITLTAVDTGSNYFVAKAIEDVWSSVGVKVNVNMVSGEQIIDIIRERDFEALLYGQAIGGDPDVYSFWHSSQIGNGLNLAGYNNGKVDQLLSDARKEVGYDKRQSMYVEIEEIIIEDYPAVFLYHPSYTYLQSRDLRGFSGQVIISQSDRFEDVISWYLKTRFTINR